MNSHPNYIAINVMDGNISIMHNVDTAKTAIKY